MKLLLKKILFKLSKYKKYSRFIEDIYHYSNLKESGNHLISFTDFSPLSNKQMQQMNDVNSILICTFEKSGTYWLRALIGNYFHQIISPEDNQALSSKQLKSNYFNTWRNCESSESNFVKAVNFKKDFNFNSVLFQHILMFDLDIHHFLGKKIIVTRNPLDLLISNYYFWDLHMKINLNEFIPYYVTRFAKSYSYLKKINNLDKDKSIIICYENLKRDTKKTLKDILHFMEIVYDDDLVDETINRSSIKMVKSFEKKGEYYSDKNKSHIRNGGIGEWKNYLRRKDINYIEKILSEFKLSLNMFILE